MIQPEELEAHFYHTMMDFDSLIDEYGLPFIFKKCPGLYDEIYEYVMDRYAH